MALAIALTHATASVGGPPPIPGAVDLESRPSTLVYVDPGAGSPYGIAQRLWTAAAGEILVTRRISGGDELFFVGAYDPENGSMTIEFMPPRGQTLAPGTYEPVSELFLGPVDTAQAELAASTCALEPKRFVVHEVVLGPADDVKRLAADFTFECRDSGTPVYVAVRYRTGDDECAGQPDGAACEDLDACTSSTCGQGLCVATAWPTCPAPPVCGQQTICNPIDGTCPTGVYPVVDGGTCDDHTACTYSECLDGICASAAVNDCTPAATCANVADGTPCVHTDSCSHGGVCRSGDCIGAEPRDCDDGNPCTDDACDPFAGCVHTLAAGTCYDLDGRWSRTISTPDATCTCTSKASGVLLLRPDFRYVRSAVGCDGTRIDDEVGRWRSTGRRVVLEPDADFGLRLKSFCFGDLASVTRRGAFGAAKAPGRLRGSLVERGRVGSLGLRSVTRVRAVAGHGDVDSAPSASAVRCLRRIARCLPSSLER